MWFDMLERNDREGMLRVPVCCRSLASGSLAIWIGVCALVLVGWSVPATAVANTDTARVAAESYWSAVVRGDARTAWSMLTAKLRRAVPRDAMVSYATGWVTAAKQAAARGDATKASWRVRVSTVVLDELHRAAFLVEYSLPSRGQVSPSKTGAYLRLESGHWRVASPTGLEPFDWAPRTTEEVEVAAVATRFIRGLNDGNSSVYDLGGKSFKQRVSRTQFAARGKPLKGSLHLILLGCPVKEQGKECWLIRSVGWGAFHGKVSLAEMQPLRIGKEDNEWRIE